jgi:hypothetical protein
MTRSGPSESKHQKAKSETMMEVDRLVLQVMAGRTRKCKLTVATLRMRKEGDLLKHGLLKHAFRTAQCLEQPHQSDKNEHALPKLNVLDNQTLDHQKDE